MISKCQTCKVHWNVSPYHIYPKGGYECPKCETERKKSERIKRIRKDIEKYITP